MDFAGVFCEKQALLPPRRPHNCLIDLLPGTTPHRSRVYPKCFLRLRRCPHALKRIWIRVSSASRLLPLVQDSSSWRKKTALFGHVSRFEEDHSQEQVPLSLDPRAVQQNPGSQSFHQEEPTL